MIERVVRVGAIDDPAEQNERRIGHQLVLFQDRLERTLLAVMAQLYVLDVVGDCIETFRLVHYLVGRDEDELGVVVDEFLDKPRAGYAIDFYVFASDPFHSVLLNYKSW